MYSDKNYAPATDAELLAGAASGNDRGALPTLMKRHRWIKGIFFNILHDTEEEKDAWQDTWLGVVQCLQNNYYLKIQNFPAWLRSETVKAALMIKRRGKRYVRNDDALKKAENVGEDFRNNKLGKEDAEEKDEWRQDGN